jgi:hypothetical protein
MVDKLNKDVNTTFAELGLKARLSELGGAMLAGSADELANLIACQAVKWAKVIKVAGPNQNKAQFSMFPVRASTTRCRAASSFLAASPEWVKSGCRALPPPRRDLLR